MDETLAEIVALTETDPVVAVDALDRVYSDNAHHDHGGWLYRSVCLHRGFFFYRQQRYADAFAEFQDVVNVILRSLDQLISARSGSAEALQRLNRFNEAIAEIEGAILIASILDDARLLRLLKQYARITHEMGGTMPSSLQELTARCAKAWGIEVPEELLWAERTPDDAVRFMGQQEHEGNRREQEMIFALQKATTLDERIRIVNDRVRSESVGFYRKMAEKRLEMLMAQEDTKR